MTDFANRSPRVLVAGDCMIDEYVSGAAERISPEAPVPVIRVQTETSSLGGAGNVVANLLSLGARVNLVSVVGDDARGGELMELLAERGVDTAGVIAEPGRQTTQKIRILATGQQVIRIDRESVVPIRSTTQRALLETVFDSEPPDIVLVSDYNKGLLTPSLTRELIRFARERSIPILVDPKGSDYAKYRGATLLAPNKREATHLTGIEIEDDASLCAAGEKLRRQLDLEYALITLSEDGMALFGEELTRIRATTQEVYDVTGAGDTVLATLGFALACGSSMVEAAELGNRAAAVVVGKLGSATVSIEEILQQTNDAGMPDEGIVVASRTALDDLVQKERARGQKIVFTNGCFDLLHRGHLEYLRASRACGDVLIVGVNSDDSVRRLKGDGRPVVAESDRAHLLAALGCVDCVVVFEEDTPRELIERIRPDVLTKSSDYTEREVVGREIAGEVRLIELVDGRSTTATIRRIKNAA